MTTLLTKTKRNFRPASTLLVALLSLPLFTACGQRQAEAPSQDTMHTTTTTGTAPGNSSSAAPTAQKKGMTNLQKGAIVLAGAAALYYIYNKHKHVQEKTGENGQYYLSKNGRVYYRDANHQAHWVTPPSGGIQVPADEAQQYRDYQGYDNQTTGRDLTSVPEAQTATN